MIAAYGDVYEKKPARPADMYDLYGYKYINSANEKLSLLFAFIPNTDAVAGIFIVKDN